MNGPYELRFFADVLDWLNDLAKEDRDSYLHVLAALERLQQEGPALRRPTVGAINDSRFRNMRELRPRNGSTVCIRMLFVFDPARRAIFLVAGNKAAKRHWNAWYPGAIREADARYQAYLEALEEEDEDR
ncbi:type II toxin-antitoxin system RelE/ParE family toxin [Streptomyces hainanensis]|uniref:Addiction module toxin RelE n=1 Tax=Streptomyces hainanensis TaxID=402648 RepID=A0A4R4TPD6_9ACTN|nr:type II toxin-antitoxin system RelE/ParE family toxin [Streptomyces hainanensis]TDC79987.1 addiction module toxin RelE [Streptomyces hainanensis]